MNKNLSENKIKYSQINRAIITCVINALISFIAIIVILSISVGGFNATFEYLKIYDNLVNFLYPYILMVFTFVIMCVYYYREKKEFFSKKLNIVMLFSIMYVSIIISFLFTYIKININGESVNTTYIIPFGLCSLLSLYLIDKKSAIFNTFVCCVLILIVNSFSTKMLFDLNKDDVVMLLMCFIEGLLSIYIVDGTSSRLKILYKGLIISLPVAFSGLLFELSFNYKVDIIVFCLGLSSGVISTAITTLLLPIFENIFKVITDFRLNELVDHKSFLLTELQRVAPGTFNHVVTVSTLAEACSSAIGENPTLARVCAYYHDIGKIKNSEFFSENKIEDDPHKDISPELSASIIKGHALNGYNLIKKLRLPDVLAQTCLEHHGTTTIKYFYAKAKQYFDSEINISAYSYDGPKPTTKINAIIMICDACEARLRSMSNRSHESVDKAVKEIIEERIDDDQFTDCNITMKELSIIRLTVTNTLSGVYHSRVKYPKIKVGKEESVDAESKL